MAFVNVRAEQVGNHPPVSCMVDVSGVPHTIVRDIVQTDGEFVYRTLVKDAQGVTVFGVSQVVPRNGRGML